MNKVFAFLLIGAIGVFFYMGGGAQLRSVVTGEPAPVKVTKSTSGQSVTKEPTVLDKDAPRRMIIGLDLSASNPLVVDSSYAQKVGTRLNKEINSLTWRSEFKLRTFGAYGASNNPIAFDATISSKQRPEVVGRDTNAFIARIPTLVKQGQLEAQPYTNILAFLEELSIELDCSELPTQIILVTDGIEDSEYARLNYQGSQLPKPKKIFKGCYELQILGVGRSMKSPSETKRIRDEWEAWAKRAGFEKYTAVNDW